MRNLKKVLALVLAVVMIFGVMSLTSATFTDDANVTNTEAVEVMAGLKILEGYTDGSYKPEGNVTREEMATIICKMLLGPDVAKTLAQGTSNFKDVEATRWSAGYIEYCANLGIIDGYGDGTFKPTGNVTIGEAAKMLLVAAGIKGTYTGADWLVNVTAAATKAGILPTSVDVRATATRDQVALYAFNALNYSANSSIVYNVYNEKIGFKANYTDATQAYMAKLLLGEDAVVTTKTVAEASLGYKVFKLVKEGYTDGYGRPATLWYTDVNKNGNYDGKFVSGAFTIADEYVYLYVQDADQVYTTPIDPVTFREMIASYNALGLTVYDKADVETATQITTSNAATYAANTGYGTRTEFYVDAASGKVTIIFVPEHVATVTNITSYPATAYQGAYTQYTLSDVKVAQAGDSNAPVYIKVFTSHVKDLIEKDTGSVDAGVTVGSTVVYTVQGDGFVEAKLANSFSGVVTSYDAANQTVVINGTTYNVAACAKINGTVEQMAAGLTALFYVDQYGYIAYADFDQAVEYAQANYIALYDSKTSKGESVAKYLEAQLVFADGTTKVVTVDTIDNKTAATLAGEAGTDYDLTTGRLGAYELDAFTYTVNETTGVYTLTHVADKLAETKTISATQFYAGSDRLANNATTFVVRTGDVGSYKWNVYTGFESLPTLAANANVTVAKTVENVDTLVYIASTAANTLAHDYVYITSTNYTTDFVAPRVVKYTFKTADGEGLVVAADKLDYIAKESTGKGAGLYLVKEYDPSGAAANLEYIDPDTVEAAGVQGLITIGSKTWHYTADSKLVVYVNGTPTEGYTFENLPKDSDTRYEYSVKAYVEPKTTIVSGKVEDTTFIDTAYVVITLNLTED